MGTGKISSNSTLQYANTIFKLCSKAANLTATHTKTLVRYCSIHNAYNFLVASFVYYEEIYSCCEGFRAGEFDVLMLPPSFLLCYSEYYEAWVDGKYIGYTLMQLI